MNTARQIINEIIQEGAKFTLHGGDVGLTKIVSDELLERARQHKTKIKQILEAVIRDSRNKSPKVWQIKIKSYDKKSIDNMTMIDSARLSHEECKAHLDMKFGKGRVIELNERIGI